MVPSCAFHPLLDHALVEPKQHSMADDHKSNQYQNSPRSCKRNSRSRTLGQVHAGLFDSPCQHHCPLSITVTKRHQQASTDAKKGQLFFDRLRPEVGCLTYLNCYLGPVSQDRKLLGKSVPASVIQRRSAEQLGAKTPD